MTLTRISVFFFLFFCFSPFSRSHTLFRQPLLGGPHLTAIHESTIADFVSDNSRMKLVSNDTLEIRWSKLNLIIHVQIDTLYSAILRNKTRSNFFSSLKPLPVSKRGTRSSVATSLSSYPAGASIQFHAYPLVSNLLREIFRHEVYTWLWQVCTGG